ncbi:hypothetical protein DLM78_15600 [Leptospira stimsonii]|uniref:Uncharacterized protein n=1 Tax=Leptospira stimsonii TaxID=2202203 RepID=A0A8B3CMI1_9LEPT|nr:hypothetical protein DLM78_15600 [Leptospira stimsonii]
MVSKESSRIKIRFSRVTFFSFYLNRKNRGDAPKPCNKTREFPQITSLEGIPILTLTNLLWEFPQIEVLTNNRI